MIHTKISNTKIMKTPKGTLIIEGPIPADTLEHYEFHKHLLAFRPSDEQYKAIIEISRLPEARIIVARLEHLIVGYVTYLYPDPLERWSEANMYNLLELGAIEVIPDFRGLSVGKAMLEVSMMDEHMDDYIIITTEYYWHWDLKGTELNVWEYRKVMERMMHAGGLVWMATDDPEICSHPANCLMVRIGKRVDQASIESFDRLRFQNRFMY